MFWWNSTRTTAATTARTLRHHTANRSTTSKTMPNTIGNGQEQQLHIKATTTTTATATGQSPPLRMEEHPRHSNEYMFAINSGWGAW